MIRMAIAEMSPTEPLRTVVTSQIVLASSLSEKSTVELAQRIVQSEHESYPETWIYEDAERYFIDYLQDRRNIVLFILEEGNIVGHLLAGPLSASLSELAPFDPCISESDPGSYYIDTLAASRRNGRVAIRRLVRTLEAELQSRGVRHLCMHARVSNGLSRVITRIYGPKVVRKRTIPEWEWYCKQEPTEFLDVQLYP